MVNEAHLKNSNNLKGLLGCQICQSRHGHRQLLPKGLEGPEGLLHFSEIPMSVDHSGRLENAPKHALATPALAKNLVIKPPKYLKAYIP